MNAAQPHATPCNPMQPHAEPHGSLHTMQAHATEIARCGMPAPTGQLLQSMRRADAPALLVVRPIGLPPRGQDAGWTGQSVTSKEERGVLQLTSS